MIRKPASAVASTAAIELLRLDEWITLLRRERGILESWMKHSDYRSYLRSKPK